MNRVEIILRVNGGVEYGGSTQSTELNLTDEYLLSVEEDISKLLNEWREARAKHVKAKK